MNAIRSVFAAFTNLAASLNALSAVVDCATGRLRQTLALDSEPAALPHAGEVIDGNTSEAEAAPKAKKGKASAV